MRSSAIFPGHNAGPRGTFRGGCTSWPGGGVTWPRIRGGPSDSPGRRIGFLGRMGRSGAAASPARPPARPSRRNAFCASLGLLFFFLRLRGEMFLMTWPEIPFATCLSYYLGYFIFFVFFIYLCLRVFKRAFVIVFFYINPRGSAMAKCIYRYAEVCKQENFTLT